MISIGEKIIENWQIGKLYKLKCNFMKILVLQISFPFNKSSYYNQLLYNYIRFFVPSYSLWNITSFFSSARLIVLLTMNQPLLRISWRSEWKIRKKISSVRGILSNNWFHFHFIKDLIISSPVARNCILEQIDSIVSKSIDIDVIAPIKRYFKKSNER